MPTSTRSRRSVSGLAVWRLNDDVLEPATARTVDQATHAAGPHVTGWAVVSWQVGRPAPRILSTGPEGGALDPACWHLLFGGMLLTPLLDVRSGGPFRDPPPRRQEIDVFVNRVRDLVVPGTWVLATLGPAAQVFTAADAVHDALGLRSALAGATLALTDREAAIVAEAFLEPELVGAAAAR